MKQKLIKKLHDLMLQIITCNDAELDKIGIELAEIEKQLINWQEKKSQKKSIPTSSGRFNMKLTMALL